MAVSAEIRTRLATCAQSRRTRRTDFTAHAPCKWQPGQVTDPSTGQAFTEDAAWQFVADALLAGAPIEMIALDKPPGKSAYVMKLPGAQGAEIYVKLQIGADHVRGRSFHPSEKPSNNLSSLPRLEVSDAKSDD
jgi:hypothetical protein